MPFLPEGYLKIKRVLSTLYYIAWFPEWTSAASRNSIVWISLLNSDYKNDYNQVSIEALYLLKHQNTSSFDGILAYKQEFLFLWLVKCKLLLFLTSCEENLVQTVAITRFSQRSFFSSLSHSPKREPRKNLLSKGCLFYSACFCWCSRWGKIFRIWSVEFQTR